MGPQKRGGMAFRELSDVGTRGDLGEGGVPGEGMEALHSFPILCPLRLFHLAVPELHSFKINW